MKRSILGLSAAALLFSCATGKSAEKSGTTAAAAPKEARERLQNVGYFDIGTCTAKPPKVPERITSEVLLGELISAQPVVMECLVNPKNRGPADDTKVVIDQSLTDTGVESKVTGTNLSPEGTACITEALNKWTAQLPSMKAKNAYAAKTDKGAQPVAGHFELQHRVGVSPSVKMGSNWASDVVGKIRLTEPQWCDCFAGDTIPHGLKANATFNKGKAGETEISPTDVTFDPSSDPASEKVASCLKGKVMAMKFPAPPADNFKLPVSFSLINSEATQPLGADAIPQVAFSQFDALRGKKSAEAAIAVGSFMVARNNYAEAVDKYKQAPKATNYKLVPGLKEKCKQMLKEDDAFSAALQEQLAVEKQTHEFAAALKAKDAMWSDTEAASAQQAQQTEQQLAASKQQRKADEATCPKEHY